MSYEIVDYNSRRWVSRQGRLLGAYSSNELRSYAFPLYTPDGVLVIQESPPDHLHHQGIWTGLEVDGKDLWNAGSFQVPRHRQELVGPLAQIDAKVDGSGVRFSHEARWVSVDGIELLREKRAVGFSAGDGYTMVEWQSVFGHPTKAAQLGQTKESGLGVRVPPHWETRFGGTIRNADGATGEPECFDKMSPWLNVEGSAGGGRIAGLVLIPTSAACPWFTRDYGIHVYNPARHAQITIGADEEVTWSMRVLAYDGARSIAQVNALVASAT